MRSARAFEQNMELGLRIKIYWHLSQWDDATFPCAVPNGARVLLLGSFSVESYELASEQQQFQVRFAWRTDGDTVNSQLPWYLPADAADISATSSMEQVDRLLTNSGHDAEHPASRAPSESPQGIQQVSRCTSCHRVIWRTSWSQMACDSCGVSFLKWTSLCHQTADHIHIWQNGEAVRAVSFEPPKKAHVRLELDIIGCRIDLGYSSFLHGDGAVLTRRLMNWQDQVVVSVATGRRARSCADKGSRLDLHVRARLAGPASRAPLFGWR